MYNANNSLPLFNGLLDGIIIYIPQIQRSIGSSMFIEANNSLLNSIVVVLFLSGLIAMILYRALHRDIARYNIIDDEEGIQEDSGWKLVHADVFRPPRHASWFSVLIGIYFSCWLLLSCFPHLDSYPQHNVDHIGMV
jgi:hypothetical protein